MEQQKKQHQPPHESRCSAHHPIARFSGMGNQLSMPLAPISPGLPAINGSSLAHWQSVSYLRAPLHPVPILKTECEHIWAIGKTPGRQVLYGGTEWFC